MAAQSPQVDHAPCMYYNWLLPLQNYNFKPHTCFKDWDQEKEMLMVTDTGHLVMTQEFEGQNVIIYPSSYVALDVEPLEAESPEGEINLEDGDEEALYGGKAHYIWRKLDEVLIETVFNYPTLWNSHMDVKKRTGSKRDDAWETVQLKLNGRRTCVRTNSTLPHHQQSADLEVMSIPRRRRNGRVEFGVAPNTPQPPAAEALQLLVHLSIQPAASLGRAVVFRLPRATHTIFPGMLQQQGQFRYCNYQEKVEAFAQKEKKIRNPPSGSEGLAPQERPRKGFRYYEKMRFITDHQIEVPTTSNAAPNADEDEDDENACPNSNSPAGNSNQTPEKPYRYQNKKRRRSDEPPMKEKLLEAIMQTPNAPDRIDGLLILWGSTLRKLPERQSLMIMKWHILTNKRAIIAVDGSLSPRLNIDALFTFIFMLNLRI
ncbi:hypothetical protein QAD02_004522 [Eretmocerus hayati]|uniref:Uncharacterized protein n=1 Tax=Eretmocerus hayati TaxID=131215 RepID=A0ACC2NUM4_9HYME|nr:hypothetical protein QAD02_004522 [Eretmocerus hayati]